MSRWGKNIVVPLDSLCKEKENTNRPTVARSVGTVGKWGKMGFTSTRTYTLSGLPAAVAAAAAAAAAAASPGQSPASALDDDMSPSAPEPPKPKKFFKSRNAAPPEVVAQIIQHLPRVSTSPIRDAATGSYLTTPVHGREPIKLKIAKNNKRELKKKSPKKAAKSLKAPAEAIAEPTDNADDAAIPKQSVEAKSKKKKEEKKLKPEAPPSRVISRARKAVNYCEDDEDDRMPTPIKDLIIAKDKPSITGEDGTPAEKTPAAITSDNIPASVQPELPPPAALPLSTSLSSVPVISNAGATPSNSAVNMTPKTPEHPPIVLRISKGTSRLVSTDSEELPNNGTASPAQAHDTELAKSRHASTEEVPPATHVNTLTTPKIIVKPPKPPSPEPAPPALLLNNDEPPEINYSTVKISPDKPPKERLKLIIKTDVIRNALAAAAAAAAAKAAAAAQKQAAAEAAALSGAEGVERPEKEKKQKSKKHKHLKHAAIEQLIPAHMPTAVAGSEFKTPSPHLALGASVAGEREQQQHQQNIQQAATARTVISPPALSERDFDSQSSVLGSISSKGNSTPQPLAQTVQEESCVIHSRGSSVITSDLETSQHSSLVAPPSDIESRLESMMMDGEASQKPANLLVEEEPLQEDILAVLRGDESVMDNTDTIDNGDVNMNDVTVEKIRDKPADKENQKTASKRRVTRGRTRGATTKTNYAEEEDVTSPQQTLPIATVAAVTTARTTRGRGKTAVAAVATSPSAAEEASLPKRATRRGVKKTDETTTAITAMQIDDSPTKLPSVTTEAEKTTPSKLVEENAAVKLQLVSESPVTRRGRATRIANNNQNHHANNNSNINKIAANLSARAGAAEEAKSTSSISPTITSTTTTTPPSQTPRSYGRKRKNQQVTQVLQPSAEELEEQQQQHPAPSKMLHIDLPTHNEGTSATTLSPSTNYDQRQQRTPNLDLHDTNSNNSNSLTRPPSTTNSSPPRRDYKVKDKFKRTLTLDSQVNCNAVIASPTASASDEMGLVVACIPDQHKGNVEKQRGSVKLVISKKKGSIFKSRALGSADPSEQTTATKRHLYKHRWDAEASGEQANNAAARIPADTPEPATSSARNPAAAVAAIFDDFDDDAETNTNSRDAVSTFKANPFRVGNVKSAHEMQEMGETLELDDNVRYVMDALQPSNATPTRCLSAVRLAKECMKHDFRMHVRAHGVVNKFYRVLSDAHQYASLGLCTAAIMYILSQEGLSNDLDRDSFALMMNLLKADGNAAASDRACYESNRQKIRILCEEMSTPGRPSYLNMDSLTASSLAMETLFALTSKCASEWFKEALRELGGLEHFMKLISDSCRPVLEGGVSVGGGGIGKPPAPIAWTQLLLDNTKTVERCMRAMENVTHLNVKNQKYLLKYAEGTCVNTMCTLYCLCDRELVLHPTTDDTTDKHHPGVVIRELLLAVLKVLNTLTYTLNPANPLGAETVGERVDVIETSFCLLLQAPNYIPDRCVFDMSILVLNLLNNLAMHSKSSRALIMKTYAPPGYSSHQQNKVTAVQAVIEYFYKCEEMARLVDEDTDANLEKTAKTKKRQEAVDENALILLQGADRHMEHTLKGSYAGLLIGHLIKDSEENEAIMRTHLPVVGFKDIVSILEKYYKFMVLTGNTEASFVGHMKSTQDVIDYFRKRDLIYEMNDNAFPLNLETHHVGAANTSSSTTAPAATEDDSPSTSRAAVTRSGAPRMYKTYSQR